MALVRPLLEMEKRNNLYAGSTLYEQKMAGGIEYIAYRGFDPTLMVKNKPSNFNNARYLLQSDIIEYQFDLLPLGKEMDMFQEVKYREYKINFLLSNGKNGYYPAFSSRFESNGINMSILQNIGLEMVNADIIGIPAMSPTATLATNLLNSFVDPMTTLGVLFVTDMMTGERNLAGFTVSTATSMTTDILSNTIIEALNITNPVTAISIQIGTTAVIQEMLEIATGMDAVFGLGGSIVENTGKKSTSLYEGSKSISQYVKQSIAKFQKDIVVTKLDLINWDQEKVGEMEEFASMDLQGFVANVGIEYDEKGTAINIDRSFGTITRDKKGFFTGDVVYTWDTNFEKGTWDYEEYDTGTGAYESDFGDTKGMHGHASFDPSTGWYSAEYTDPITGITSYTEGNINDPDSVSSYTSEELNAMNEAAYGTPDDKDTTDYGYGSVNDNKDSSIGSYGSDDGGSDGDNGGSSDGGDGGGGCGCSGCGCSAW